MPFVAVESTCDTEAVGFNKLAKLLVIADVVFEYTLELFLGQRRLSLLLIASLARIDLLVNISIRVAALLKKLYINLIR